MNGFLQVIVASITVASFIGGIILAFFHLSVKSNLNEAKNEILKAVEEKYVMTILAEQKEAELRRRLRTLEQKVFGRKVPETTNDL